MRDQYRLKNFVSEQNCYFVMRMKSTINQNQTFLRELMRKQCFPKELKTIAAFCKKNLHEKLQIEI